MDGMFDHNHDGKLSDSERGERDYFLSGMTKDSDKKYQPKNSSGSDGKGSPLLVALFVMLGAGSFMYFPWFSLIMFGLAIFFYFH